MTLQKPRPVGGARLTPKVPSPSSSFGVIYTRNRPQLPFSPTVRPRGQRRTILKLEVTCAGGTESGRSKFTEICGQLDDGRDEWLSWRRSLRSDCSLVHDAVSSVIADPVWSMSRLPLDAMRGSLFDPTTGRISHYIL